MSQVDEDKREIEREVDTQTRSLNELDAALGDLQGRLESVLSPQPPNDSGIGEERSEPSTDLGARLRYLNVQVSNMHSKVESMLGRCGV